MWWTVSMNDFLLPARIISSLILNFLNQIFSLNFHLSLDTALHKHSTVENRIARRSTLVTMFEFCTTICFKWLSINEFDSFRSQFSMIFFQLFVLFSLNFGIVNEWILKFLRKTNSGSLYDEALTYMFSFDRFMW